MKKIIAVVMLLVSSISYAYINLYPLEFNKDITQGAGERFVLYNRSTKDRRYRIYVESVEGKESMADWIEVYPKSISLQPLREKAVRVYVTPPANTTQGEYQANLVIKEVALPTPQQDKEEQEKKTRVMTMVKLRLKGRVNYE